MRQRLALALAAGVTVLGGCSSSEGGGDRQPPAGPRVSGCSSIDYGGERFEADCQGASSFDLSASKNGVDLPPQHVVCSDGCIAGISSPASGGSGGTGGTSCNPGATCADDCATSSACRSFGLCGKNERGECVGTEAGCQATASCELDGRCHYDPTASPSDPCVAQSDADCQAAGGACTISGDCHELAGTCVPFTSDECRAAELCAYAGSCSLVDDDCTVASDADCAGAEVCAKYGQCSAFDGSCSTLAACQIDCDCAPSEGCSGGRCVYDYTKYHPECSG